VEQAVGAGRGKQRGEEAASDDGRRGSREKRPEWMVQELFV
jgi:hypothetical protein